MLMIWDRPKLHTNVETMQIIMTSFSYERFVMLAKYSDADDVNPIAVVKHAKATTIAIMNRPNLPIKESMIAINNDAWLMFPSIISSLRAGAHDAPRYVRPP